MAWVSVWTDRPSIRCHETTITEDLGRRLTGLEAVAASAGSRPEDRGLGQVVVVDCDWSRLGPKTRGSLFEGLCI